MNNKKTCPICCKEFQKPYHKSIKNWEKTTYCSLKCYGQAKSKQIVINCAYCSKSISIKYSANKRTKRKFCSSKCYHLFRSELLPKEEQPRYGHGFSVEERNRRKKARSILNHYLRDNKIERPVCEVCGSNNAEAHHEDYSKPLDVQWLCFKHHRETHKAAHLLIPSQKGDVLNTMNTDPNNPQASEQEAAGQAQADVANEQVAAVEQEAQEQAMESAEEGSTEG